LGYKRGVITQRMTTTGTAGAMTASADYPLYVVTASLGDEVSGCLAGFVTQCSISPVRFIVCISKVNHTFGIAERSKSLALHLLGADQLAMASIFGELTGDVTDKFERVQWAPGFTGAPVLSECAAWAEGSILNRMSGGDHEAFLLAVRDGGRGHHEGRLMLSDAPGLEPGHPA
jgi:flavin reductase (DIM6/NTAB) family NADH-FMN oxidoreductase RutF